MKRVLWRAFLVVLVCAALRPTTGASAWAGDDRLPQCGANQFTNVQRYFFSPDFARDQIVFAKAVRAGDKGWQLYRSADGGRTWSLNLSENLADMVFSPQYAADQVIYASRYTGAGGPYFLRSQDGGETWDRLMTPADGPWTGGFSSIAVEDENTIWFAESGAPIWPDPLSYGLYRFTFTGADVVWERLSDKRINEIALSPDFAADQTLLIGAYDYKVNYGPYKSTDGGRIWRSIDNGIDLTFNGLSGATESLLFAPDYPADSLLFAEALSKFYRSADGGQSWQRVDPFGPNPPTPSEPARWVLSPNFTEDRTAWIDYGAWITRDAGDTWRPTGGKQVMDLAARAWCEGDRCGTLLLGGGSARAERIGVYKSYDLGWTWQCADAPAPGWWPNVPPVVATWLPVVFK